MNRPATAKAGRFRSGLSVVLVAVLLVWQTGCAAKSQPQSHEVRQSWPVPSMFAPLGPTGVMAVWGTERPGVVEPPSGWLTGAGRGALVGAVVTTVGGAAVGSLPMGESGRGAGGWLGLAWFLGWTTLGLVLAPVGATVGAVVGAVKAPPPEQIRRAQGALVRAAATADLPGTIRDETIRLGTEQSRHTLVPMTGQGLEAADSDVGTVLEIVIRNVGLEGRTIPRLPESSPSVWLDMDPEFELRLDVDVRLLKASDGAVLYADALQEVGALRKFSGGAADDARAVREGLGEVAERLAMRIATTVFPAPEPAPAPEQPPPRQEM